MKVVKLPTSKARMENFSKQVSTVFPVGEEFLPKDYVSEYNSKFGESLTDKTFQFYASVVIRAGMLKNAVRIKSNVPFSPDKYIVVNRDMGHLPPPKYEVVERKRKLSKLKSKKVNTISNKTFKKFINSVKPLIKKDEYWLPKRVFEQNKSSISYTYGTFMYYISACKKRGLWNGLVRKRGSDGSFWYKLESLGLPEKNSDAKYHSVIKKATPPQRKKGEKSECFSCDRNNSVGARFCQWCGKPQESIHQISVDSNTFEVIVPMGMPGVVDMAQYLKENIDIKVSPMEGSGDGYVISVCMKEA